MEDCDFNEVFPTTSTKCVARKKIVTIVPEISHRGFTEEVVEEADFIHDLLWKHIGTKRKQTRKKLLFYCVLCAHLQLAKPHDPIDIAKVFDLSSSEVSNTYSIFAPSNTGGYVKPKVDHGRFYVEYFSQKIGLSETSTQEILQLYDQLSKHRELRAISARNFACGVLDTYLTMNGHEVEGLEKLVHLTPSLIKKSREMVMKFM